MAAGGRLARALPRGDPGRAGRLAQHHPLLRPRSQRLRGLPEGARAQDYATRRPGRGRGLPRRSGRPRDGAGDPGAAAVGDPPALPLRLPRRLARGRSRGADQGAEAPAARCPAASARARSTGCSTRAETLGRTEAERLRDTCLMQILYATGLRVSELVSLPVVAVARRSADDPGARQGRARAHGAALAAGARRARRLARASRRAARTGRARPRSPFLFPARGPARAHDPRALLPAGQGSRAPRRARRRRRSRRTRCGTPSPPISSPTAPTCG